MIRTIDSYTEVSPSRTGVRIFARGKLPGKNWRNGTFEVYDAGSPRFMTVTGHHLDGTPTTVETRPYQILGFHRDRIARPESAKTTKAEATGPPTMEITGDVDTEFAAKCLALALADPKTKALFGGDWAGRYPSQSEADGALVALLAFYTGPRPGVVDHLFRQSAMLRDKWDLAPRQSHQSGVRIVRAGLDRIKGAAKDAPGERNTNPEVMDAGPKPLATICQPL